MAIVVLVAAGCGAADGNDPKPQIDLGPASSFRGFTLYYVGRKAGKLPLLFDGSDDLRPYHRGHPVNFAYGDCTPTPNSEGSCSPPLVVTNAPICKELPSRYRRSDIGGRIQVRGVPAVVFGGKDRSFWKLEVYTGRTTVTIDGLGYSQTLDLARRLTPLNHRPFGRKLPQPAPACARRELLSPNG